MISLTTLFSRGTMMSIGPYDFSIDTAAYQNLKRGASWRWAAQELIGRKSERQFVGADAQTLDFDGIILPAFRGGPFQIDAMRDLGDSGEPQLLVDGLGYVWGDWVIEKIDETQREFTQDGVARAIAFTMTLTEYGDNDRRARSNSVVSDIIRLFS